MRLIVDTQGTRLRKAGERLLIENKENETPESVPLNVLEQVILAGRGVHATTPLLYDLLARGIDVVYQSQHGRFGFRLVGPVAKHSALRVQQMQVCTHAKQALPLARAMVAGKLHNQSVLLRRYRQALAGAGAATIQFINRQRQQAHQAADADALRGYAAALPPRTSGSGPSSSTHNVGDSKAAPITRPRILSTLC